MYRFSAWLCCLVLAGCESRVAVVTPVTVVKHPAFTELRNDRIVSKVRVLESMPPVTLTFTTDEDDVKVSYAARTEHDCQARISTLKYLAVFNSDELVNESEVNVEIEVEPGSIGEAELVLACATNPKGTV